MRARWLTFLGCPAAGNLLLFGWSRIRPMVPALRCFSALALVAALSGCTMWEQRQQPSAWSSATGAEQFERLLWQEVKAGNWNEVERRLAPTYVEVTSAGVRDRAQAVERLKALSLADYSLGDLQVRPAGDDMVVAYTITLRASSGGESTLRMMTVWQQIKGGWIAIAHSETTASP